MHANVVIAIGPDEALPAILAHIHHAGLGGNALVLRPRRTSIQRQLERAGIPIGNMPSRVNDADGALLVHAAARAPLAADITRLHGASATWIVSPDGTWQIIDDDIVPVHTIPASVRPDVPLSIPLTGDTAVPDESTDI